MVLVATSVLMGLLVLIESIPPLVFGLGGTFAMYFTAQIMFGKEVGEHFARGGRRVSGGVAVGWALLGMLLMFGVLFAVGIVAAVIRGEI